MDSTPIETDGEGHHEGPTVAAYPSLLQLEKADPFLSAHNGYVVIQEKVDGSNVAVRMVDGEFVLQSRSTILDQTHQQKGFKRFIDWAQAKKRGLFEDADYVSQDDYIYFGEMVGMGKIKYDQETPPFLLFDIAAPYRDGEGTERLFFLPYEEVTNIAQRLEIPLIPTLWYGRYQGMEHVKSLLGQSMYTDKMAEGVVVKARGVTAWYTRSDGEEIKYTADLLGGKFVREDFKETKSIKVREEVDPLEAIAEALVSDARVHKAKQRLEEEGKDYHDKPHLLIPLVAQDVFKENEAEIMAALLQAYKKPLNKLVAQKVLELA